jgi:hypothetical protein
MTDFSQLKKSSSTSLQNLNKKLEELSNKDYSKKDENFWSLSVDEAGNGFAVIRFLPAPAGEGESEFVKLWTHGFKGPGGWYIENSLTTLGQDDPVSEYNSKLWETELPANQEQARKQKRKLSFISNIYVVKDPKNPQNEGKVFKFKYGKKIFEKITESMADPVDGDEDVVAINPFDFWIGADFKLKQRKKDGWPNFDNSEFAAQSILGNFDDATLEAIYKQEFSLKEVVDPKNFKSYEDLKKRLNKVLGNTESTAPAGTSAPAREEKVASSKMENDNPWGNEEEDEDLAFLKGLVD